MGSIALDIETYSAAPLAKTGVHRYAADPTFEIRLFAYAVDDGPVEVVGLPMSLDGVGTALHLEQQKMGEGKRLITYFCQPCEPTKVNGGRTRNLPDHEPGKWATFVGYCRRDVEVEQQIRSRLGCFPMPQHEWGLLTLGHGITTSIERDVRRCKRCPSVEPH